MNRLKGRVALITGASSGLGHAFALALAQSGVKVFLTARREENLRRVADEITAAGGEAAYHVADARSVPALYDLVDVVLARYKKLEILINNAGLGYRAPLSEIRRSEIAEMLETNLAAAVYLTQAALDALKRGAPSDIVNVCSAGPEALAEATVYSAAEAGLAAFSRGLQAELRPDNIRVTTLCPGSTDTEFFDRFRADHDPARMLSSQDAVRALLYVLASPPSVLHGDVVIRPHALPPG